MIDHVHALPAGYQLQEYRITGTLGFGGFGITYAAHDNNLDMMVAIKEYLPSELAVRVEGSTVSAKSEQDRESFDWGLERFIDEGRAVARFNHPNIIRIHRFFEQNSTGYIVMELIDGQTLSALLEENGTLEESQIRACLWPVLAGLKVVHATGYIHRDIKPQNIMINGQGEPVLLDFGAARMAIGGRTRSLTSIMTPGFAPLEQYQTSGQGPWTDIYALGAVMYKCIAGHKPQDALDRVSHDTLQAPHSGSQRVYSAGLLSGITAALAVSPGDRPQSIEDWLQILDGPVDDSTRLMPGRVSPPPPGAMSEPALPASHPTGHKTAESPVTSNQTKKASANGKWLTAIIAVTFLATAGGYWWFAVKPAPSPHTDLPAVARQELPTRSEQEPPTRPEQEPVQTQSAAPEMLKMSETPPDIAPGEAVVTAVEMEGEIAEHALEDLPPASIFRDCDQCPEMVVIPAGAFLMGSPETEAGRMNDEPTAGRVTIERPFAMGVYEVTFTEYAVFAAASARKLPEGMPPAPEKLPAFNVSWDDASAYAAWLSAQTGQHYRLPTAAEWEYAARAGADTAWWWGDEAGVNQAHCRGCGSQWDEQQPAPVGSFDANPFGLHEVHGNVAEWVADCANAQAGNMSAASSCRQHVMRGGSYVDQPQNTRSAYRYVLNTKQSRNYLGFRLAREL